MRLGDQFSRWTAGIQPRIAVHFSCRRVNFMDGRAEIDLYLLKNQLGKRFALSGANVIPRKHLSENVADDRAVGTEQYAT
jgi:hypothetical protein